MGTSKCFHYIGENHKFLNTPANYFTFCIVLGNLCSCYFPSSTVSTLEQLKLKPEYSFIERFCKYHQTQENFCIYYCYFFGFVFFFSFFCFRCRCWFGVWGFGGFFWFFVFIKHLIVRDKFVT